MSEYRSVLERAASNFPPLDLPLERVEQGRDRRGRNRRIAAGVVGVAVFVAAIWIVTSVGSLDRSEKSVAPAGEVTGPAETGPAETAPPPDPASAAPDVVEQGTCSDGARARLELTDTGDRIKVRLEVHRSPPGHSWRIHFRYMERNIYTVYHHVFFRDTRVASDDGVFVVQRRIPETFHSDGVDGKAVDRQTGEGCKVSAWYR